MGERHGHGQQPVEGERQREVDDREHRRQRHGGRRCDRDRYHPDLHGERQPLPGHEPRSGAHADLPADHVEHHHLCTNAGYTLVTFSGVGAARVHDRLQLHQEHRAPAPGPRAGSRTSWCGSSPPREPVQPLEREQRHDHGPGQPRGHQRRRVQPRASGRTGTGRRRTIKNVYFISAYSAAARARARRTSRSATTRTSTRFANVFFYTPCTATMANRTPSSGQVLAAHVSIANKFHDDLQAGPRARVTGRHRVRAGHRLRARGLSLPGRGEHRGVGSRTMSDAWLRALVALPFGLAIGQLHDGRGLARARRGRAWCDRGRGARAAAPRSANRDNIPVISWVLLRGRCRSCGERIPARYPLLELSTAALVVAGCRGLRARLGRGHDRRASSR